MSSATFYPGSTSDNGFWSGSGDLYVGGVSSSQILQLGNLYSVSESVYLVFRNVTVPKDATIESATISMRACSSKSDADCVISISADKSVSPSIPSSVSDINSRTLTTASVSGVTVPGLSYLGTYTTPDISDVVTEIVSLSGWTSGSSALFFVKDDGSDSNAYRELATADFAGGSYVASLSISWVTSGPANDGDCDLPSLSMDVFPLAMSGAVAEMSIPALQSLQLGGEALLPVMEMAATGYEYVAGAGATGSMSLRIDNDGLGGMSCSATAAPLGAMTITAATMSATAKPGNDGVLTMPLATMTARSGSRGEVELPIPTMAAWTTNPGSGALVMTQMDMSAFVFHAGLVAQGVMKLPKSKMVAHGLVGQVGRAALGVKMTMAAHGVSGQLASGVVRMVPPVAHGLASVVSKATMADSIYQLAADGIATADSSEFTGPVVYEKETIR